MSAQIKQLDIFRHDPAALARADRAAADAVMSDPAFTYAERERRRDFYLQEAERHERQAANR